MLAQSGNRQFIIVFQTLLDVVGIKSGKRTNLANVLATERKNVGDGTQGNTEIAKESTHRTKRLAEIARFNKEAVAVFIENNTRRGQELLQARTHTYRTATRTATAMRSGECFVQINMNNIETHVAGTTLAKHRVEVGAIVIHQCTTLMNKLCYLGNIFFKQAQRVWIGHHHGCNVVTKERLQVVNINKTIGS